jgi:hypothetical protein
MEKLLKRSRLWKKNASIALVSLFALAGCATPPDAPACFELDPTHGWCTYTISEKEFRVDDGHLWNGENWQQVRAKSLIVPAHSWAEIKSFILKACHQSRSCRRRIGEFERRAAEFDSMLAACQKADDGV